MKRSLALLAFLIVRTSAPADLVIEQKLESPGQSATMTTLKMKGTRLRVDVQSPAGAVSSIMDIDTGDSLTLMHAQKSALRMSGAQTKEMIETMRKKTGPAAEVAPAKPEATGRTEKVGDYNTEVFTWKTVNGVQTLWVTKDLPDFAKVKEQFDKLSKSSAANAQKGLTLDTAALPGVVVKTEMDAPGKKFTSTILSVKEEEIDATVFDAPADYKETAKPELPAPPPAAPAR